MREEALRIGDRAQPAAVDIGDADGSQATSPVAAAQPISGGNAPAAPPMTMFCGVRRFSQTV